jgi:adenosylhomocysteine nucleosidase
MILMTAATRQEREAITCCLGNRRKVSGSFAWRGTRGRTDVLAVQTGMGKHRVEDAISAILTAHRVSAIISLGFGGALTRELRTGDLVICAATVSPDGPPGESGPSRRHADEQLVRRATSQLGISGPRRVLGKGVTIPRPAADAVAKRGLRDRFAAEVCEMEDYWVSRLAGAMGIPFLAVRVIYDEFEAALPDSEQLVDPAGKINVMRATSYFITHPGQIFKSGSYFIKYRHARASLSNFVAGFLDSRET